jgi:hypothetical protein
VTLIAFLIDSHPKSTAKWSTRSLRPSAIITAEIASRWQISSAQGHQQHIFQDINYAEQHAPLVAPLFAPLIAPLVSTEALFRFEGTSMAGFPSKKSAGFM